MKPKIAVIGSTNWDMSMKVPFLPTPMETVTGGSCNFCLGGKGANQAVAAARAGGEVFFLSCIGTDNIAQEVKQELLANAIELNGIISVADTETGKAMIFVDDNGENCIGVADGANKCLTPDMLTNHITTIGNADIVLLQMEIPALTVAAAAKIATKAKATVILNPAPANNFSLDLLSYVSILTPNQKEMEQICGIHIDNDAALKNAAKSLLDKGPQIIIITLGEAGVYVVTQEESFKMPAFKVKAVDTTAAGDVFNGALAVAMASDATLREALTFAMAASALSVQKPGAIPSIPFREQIDAFMNV